jgi:hypothetical protein
VKLTSRRAAVVLTGATFALAAGVLPAQAATGASTGWRTEATVALKGKVVLMTGIDAISAGNAWADGDATTSNGKSPAGLIEHWSGKGWKAVSLPSSIKKDWAKDSAASFPVIGASSSTNVWAFGDLPASVNGDGYIRLSGHKWSAGTLPDSRISSGHELFVTGTDVISRSDVWVFGGEASEASTTLTFSPYAAQFNGTKWKTYNVPGTGAVTAASKVSRNNIWAVLGVPSLFTAGAAAAAPAVVQWNGSTWTTTAVQPTGLPAGANLTSILASSTTVWIGGGATNSKAGTSEFTAELTGSSWTEGSLSVSAAKSLYSVIDLVPDGSGGIWGLGESNEFAKPRLWHLRAGGTTWTSASNSIGGSHNALFQLAEVPGSKSVWGVGAIDHGSTTDGLFALYGATPR